MKKGTFEVYEDKAYDWRWRLKAKNNKIIAVSEGYTTIHGCLNGVKSVMDHCKDGVIVNEPNKPDYLLS